MHVIFWASAAALFVPLSRHSSPHPSPNIYLAFLGFFGLSRFLLALLSPLFCVFHMSVQSRSVTLVHWLWICFHECLFVFLKYSLLMIPGAGTGWNTPHHGTYEYRHEKRMYPLMLFLTVSTVNVSSRHF